MLIEEVQPGIYRDPSDRLYEVLCAALAVRDGEPSLIFRRMAQAPFADRGEWLHHPLARFTLLQGGEPPAEGPDTLTLIRVSSIHDLAVAYCNENSHFSFQQRKHIAYREVLAKDKAAVPELLALVRDYADGTSRYCIWFTFDCLAILTGYEPPSIEPLAPGFVIKKLASVRQDWLNWAKREGYASPPEACEACQ